MKAEMSSLNPYAASYIPLSRRGVVDEDKGCELAANASKSGNDVFWSGAHPGNTSPNQYKKSAQSYNVRGAVPEVYNPKGHTVYGSHGSSSRYPNEITEKPTFDEENEMNLIFLQMTFPDISDESIYEVYLANNGDLEGTIDMLNQLELYSANSSEYLPDTLDIGDVSESGPSSQKLNNLSVEVVGSSSGSGTHPLPTT